MRKASFASIAIAALLTLFASVGLHPEPADAAGRLALSATPTLAQTGHAVSSHGAHACQICLTHRAVPLTSLQGFLFDRGSAVYALPGETPSPYGLALPLLSDGRAPPSA